MAEVALLIDTSVRGAGVVVLGDHGTLLAEEAAPGGVDSLQAALALILSRAGRRIGQVVATRGPGSYIGVRSGLAAALAVAQAREVPLRLVGSLQVEAGRVDAAAGGLLVLRSAGRGGVLGQLFEAAGGGWRPRGPAQLLSREQSWPEAWRGAGAVADPDLLAPAELGPRLVGPRRSAAEALAMLAEEEVAAGVPYDHVSADYAVRVGAER